MSANKEAYRQAYQRAVEGRSPRSVAQSLLSLFEDEYTREARLRGGRDGQAARAAGKVGAVDPPVSL